MPSEYDSRDEQISRRAYMLWLEEGRPQGRAEAHRHLAAQAIDLDPEKAGDGGRSVPQAEPLHPARP